MGWLVSSEERNGIVSGRKNSNHTCRSRPTKTIARGMSSAEAREAAQKKPGNTLRIREGIYQMNTIGFLDSLGRDLLYALRAMRHNLTFTVVVVLTLALGIGANTAVFSVLDSVLQELVNTTAFILSLRSAQRYVAVKACASIGRWRIEW